MEDEEFEEALIKGFDIKDEDNVNKTPAKKLRKENKPNVDQHDQEEVHGELGRYKSGKKSESLDLKSGKGVNQNRIRIYLMWKKMEISLISVPNHQKQIFDGKNS